MRFVFKTDYNQDIRLLKHSGYWTSYGALFAILGIIGNLLDPVREELETAQ